MNETEESFPSVRAYYSFDPDEDFVPDYDLNEENEKDPTKPSVPLKDKYISTFSRKINSWEFLSLFLVCAFAAVVCIFNIALNLEIIKFMVNFGGISYPWFIALNVIFAFILSQMIFFPYLFDKRKKKRRVLSALYIFVVFYCLWSLALFHSRVNRGTAMIFGVVMLSAFIWLGWTCYHLDRRVVYYYLLGLIWVLYLQVYTYQVSQHPWIYPQ